MNKNQILIEKGKFTNNISKYELRKKLVEVPELKDLFEIEADKIPVVEVSQLTLDNLLRVQSESIGAEDALIEGLLKAVDNTSSDEIAKILKKGYGVGDGKSLFNKTKFEIKFCKYGIVNPKFNDSDLIKLSQLFPTVITRLSDEISKLTNLGGLKKNSGN